ncbi:WHSC1 [Cordylochernes scorpioides]|uniref:WHSC1 n=1 Tax=Cordylochernes scorpioides TaxID=51811 RepID=A0ABY6K9J2_9ARAC|nr:WHSC1 [Cordylochernes scorpioides]
MELDDSMTTPTTNHIMNEGVTEMEDKAVSIEYKVGDLLWSKISGHPSWPCIVANDPDLDIHTKVCNIRKACRIYHVFYFGEENERGWTTITGVNKFDGLEAFNKMAQEQIAKASKNAKNKIIEEFAVKCSRKEALGISVKEAEEALKMNFEERLKIINGKKEILLASRKSKKKQIVKQESDTDSDATSLSKPDAEDIQAGKHKVIKRKLKSDGIKQPNKKCKLSTQENNLEGQPKVHKDNKFVHDSDVSDSSESGILQSDDRVCLKCEKPSVDLVQCKGKCFGYFHQECLVNSSQEPLCANCDAGVHKCMICQETSTETALKRCVSSNCGRFYHDTCLKTYSSMINHEGKNNHCPHHFCLNCVQENPRSSVTNASILLKCIRCCRAFHSKRQCIAAGSIHLTGASIICSEHFEVKKHKLSSTINANWCFICSKSGSLLCCDTCPSAFHLECLNTKAPEDIFLCEDCECGKHPHYDDIVWANLGAYRWWPAKVCHPKEVPHNIAKESPQIGEFPLYFFGTKNYIWAHRGRVFGFQEDDDERTDHALAHPGLTKRFNLALEEAGKEFAKYLKKKEVSMLEMKKHLKPPQFKMIKFNKPVGNVQVPTFNEKDYNRCDCNPNSESPCSCDVDCINRSLMFECNSNLCLAKEKCQNQRFQKREYPPAEPFLTESRGWGLRSLVDIKKGQFVNEYVGELIDDEECERRIARMHKENETNFYFLTIDKDHIIDAGPKGNLSRFLNHSCNPNLETQKWIVNGETRIGLFARYDIPAKTELTFNYNLECKGNEKAKCMCGADNCSKYIGVRPLNTNSKAKSKVGIKRKKAFEKSKRDDICVYCKNRGSEMISCSYRDCPKSAHYACSLHAIQSAADNRWKCPEHLCEVCQTVSSKQCSTCSKTYCRQHYRNFL